MEIEAYSFDIECVKELPAANCHYFKVDGDWYHLTMSGGVWELRNKSGFVSLSYNNSYSAAEVVEALKSQIKANIL